MLSGKSYVNPFPFALLGAFKEITKTQGHWKINNLGLFHGDFENR